MKWARNMARMGQMRNVYNILVGKPEGRKRRGRLRRRTEMWWGCVDWMQLAQDRDQWWALVNVAMNLRLP
jgi:hypothetical protein